MEEYACNLFKLSCNHVNALVKIPLFDKLVLFLKKVDSKAAVSEHQAGNNA